MEFAQKYLFASDMSPPDMSPLNFYFMFILFVNSYEAPVTFPEIRSMDHLHLVHVKNLAADLLSLSIQHTLPPAFLRCGRTVARAELVGIVVSCDRREKFLRFLIDDGTGCVPCILSLNHEYLNASTSDPLGSGPSDYEGPRKDCHISWCKSKLLLEMWFWRRT